MQLVALSHMRDFERAGRVLLTLLRRRRRRMINVKMIEGYKETKLESLRMIHATMKAEYGDQLPPILESSIEIKKHLSDEHFTSVIIVVDVPSTGFVKRFMLLLRPPAAICWLGSLFGWMLITVCSASALVIYKCIQRLSRSGDSAQHDRPEAVSAAEPIAGADAPIVSSPAEKRMRKVCPSPLA